MNAMSRLVRALGRSHTYNLKRNPPFAWGLGIGGISGLITVGLAVAASRVGSGREVPAVAHTLLLPLFLAHSVGVGILLGAFGTVWADLRERIHRGERALERAGLVEPGTGLYSERYMREELHHALSRVARTERTVTIFILELAELRDEEALVALAETVRPLVRDSDLLGHLGIGRLLLIFHGEVACALCVAGRMGDAVHQRLRLTLQTGVARWPQDGPRPADLLDAADLILKASWGGDHGTGCREAAHPLLAAPGTSS